MLKPSPFQNISVTELVNQIICKTKSKTKLPSWYENKDIIYPSPLNIEQTSSEITAQYKSELVKGKYLVDLSGGFGVDTYYFSKQFEKACGKNMCLPCSGVETLRTRDETQLAN